MSPRCLLLLALVACAPKTVPPLTTAQMPALVLPDPAIEAAAATAEVYRGDGFAMLIPREWRKTPVFGDLRLLLSGDGIGVPATDESGQPLQVGFAVEEFAGPFASLEAFVEHYEGILRRDTSIEALVLSEQRSALLCQDQRAVLRWTGFDKAGTQRRSLYQRLLVVDGSGRGWAAAAYVSASRESSLTTPDSPLATALRPWLNTFCPAQPMEEAAAAPPP